MVLYLAAKTNTSDLMVDYITVKLNTGAEVTVDWDESGIDRYEDGFSAKYSGVYFDEQYANGRISELEGMSIIDLQLYTESEDNENVEFSIEQMEFVDGDSRLTIDNPSIGEILFD